MSSTNTQDTYSSWNDTSVAHLFTRLITKNNLPYNNTPLTQQEFDSDYQLLSGYIEWKKNHHMSSSFSLYHFTPNNMSRFLNLIDYNTQNKDELLNLWKTTMCL